MGNWTVKGSVTKITLSCFCSQIPEILKIKKHLKNLVNYDPFIPLAFLLLLSINLVIINIRNKIVKER